MNIQSKPILALLVVLALPLNVLSEETQDILIADFEGSGWGDWKVEGEAFGPAPAWGNFQGQTSVTGFQGKGFANSGYS